MLISEESREGIRLTDFINLFKDLGLFFWPCHAIYFFTTFFLIFITNPCATLVCKTSWPNTKTCCKSFTYWNKKLNEKGRL